MATAATIVKDASIMAGVLASGEDLDSERDDRFRRHLNMMLDAWSNEGIDLGIGTLASGDTLYADDSDLLGITYCLSMIICDLSRKPKDPDVKFEAMKYKRHILAQHHVPITLEVDESLLIETSYNILTGRQ